MVQQNGVVAEFAFNAFVTLLVVIDPPGMAPMFAALTRGYPTRRKRETAIWGVVLGAATLLVFGGGRGVSRIPRPPRRPVGRTKRRSIHEHDCVRQRRSPAAQLVRLHRRVPPVTREGRSL